MSEVGVEVAQPRHVDDAWLHHFGRFLAAHALFELTAAMIVGVFWFMYALGRVGYRKRDILLALIPIYGLYVVVVAVWRYTARSAYWTPRSDRPSMPLDGPSLRTVTVLGWIVIVLGALANSR